MYKRTYVPLSVPPGPKPLRARGQFVKGASSGLPGACSVFSKPISGLSGAGYGPTGTDSGLSGAGSSLPEAFSGLLGASLGFSGAGSGF